MFIKRRVTGQSPQSLSFHQFNPDYIINIDKQYIYYIDIISAHFERLIIQSVKNWRFLTKCFLGVTQDVAHQ